MTRTILIVENNLDDELLIMRAFKRSPLDCSVTVMHSGTEALEYLYSAEVLPDLLILDLKLPQLSGFEVLRRIRMHTSTKLLPVIILTSSRETRDIHNSYALGANSYIHKAIDLSEFDYSISSLVSYWFCINELPPKH